MLLSTDVSINMATVISNCNINKTASPMQLQGPWRFQIDSSKQNMINECLEPFNKSTLIWNQSGQERVGATRSMFNGR